MEKLSSAVLVVLAALVGCARGRPPASPPAEAAEAVARPTPPAATPAATAERGDLSTLPDETKLEILKQLQPSIHNVHSDDDVSPDPDPALLHQRGTFALRNYTGFVTDSPTITLSVRSGVRSRRVVHATLEKTAPAGLREVEARIGALAGVELP